MNEEFRLPISFDFQTKKTEVPSISNISKLLFPYSQLKHHTRTNKIVSVSFSTDNYFIIMNTTSFESSWSHFLIYLLVPTCVLHVGLILYQQMHVNILTRNTITTKRLTLCTDVSHTHFSLVMGIYSTLNAFSYPI